MRKLSFCLSLAVVVVVGVGILLLPTAKSVQAGDAAMVANQQDCFIYWSANTYEGSGTEVLTPSGEWKYTCSAELVSGPGVNKTVQPVGVCRGSEGVGVGIFVLDPGGRAHAGCHN